ncbi:uncharacterized protein LOC114371480 [Glycine soja]|uniref:uncharacterized protein LOC114371480 n=1 Tax=Glycine soja TaxID=3848 RepID=UPI001039BF56|nr:uncharacterized protein LOC114371480 [Glycine soja]
MSDEFCGTHLQIMVRTRGLGRALGQVTRRGVGRGDHDDSDDAPQRRRPTASARRQRVAVTADHVDELVIPDPDVQDDPMEAPAAVEDIPADAGAEAAEDQPQGFPGGPSDPSVLTAYADHFACSVWTGEERPELKLSSHGRKVHSLGSPALAIEGLIAVGELTITLDDVSSLLHLPVIGDFHAFEPLHVDDAVQMLVDLLMVSLESARAETVQCREPYIRLQWVHDIYQHRCQAGHWTATTHAYLLHLLGCTLFANKSATNVHVVYLEALRDLSMTESAGFTSTFPRLRSPPLIRTMTRLLRVRAGPVAVYYRPERVVRQFGYTQTIPAPLVDSWVSYDDIHDRWMHYEDHIVPTGEVCVVPGACSSDYIDWFFRISHPFMTPGHAVDPLPHGHAPQPRVVPQAPQTDIPRVPEPRASSTSAEEPRHVLEVCDDIAERLERHLSLGVVTPGSSTHEVIEECLRLVRSVTQDHLVYVRCRRRRRTDQA